MTEVSPKSRTAEALARIDLPTVAAIAVVAYLLQSIIHEVLGHAVAAALVGGEIVHFSSVDAEWSKAGVSAWSVRSVAAAGCVANSVVGIAVLAALKRLRHRISPATQYFAWLLGHINLFVAGGYLMVLSFAPFGDWHNFTEGLPDPFMWRFGLTVLGVAVSFAALFHAARTIEPFLGTARPARGRRAASLTLFPYLVGSTVSTLAGLFNPVGVELVFVSAMAASFGGTAFLGWLYFWVRGREWGDAVPDPITAARNRPWLGIGVLAAVVYVFVLGPGLPR